MQFVDRIGISARSNKPINNLGRTDIAAGNNEARTTKHTLKVPGPNARWRTIWGKEETNLLV